jgi:inhibitor of KinA sporulation pathway (predicted exonuclease)
MSIDYYVILDFEATCKANDLISPQEIIEFPCVLMNAKTLLVEDEFHSFVKPNFNPILTNFCTSLTGIQQSQINTAEPFPEVLKNFQLWMKNHNLLPQDNFRYEKHKRFLYVTFGDWDLLSILPNQCDQVGISVPKHFRHWVNLKQLVVRYMGVPKRASCLEISEKYMNLKWVGHNHSGIDDARNISKMLVTFVKKRFPVYITSSLTYKGRKRWKKIQQNWVFKNSENK